MALPGSEPDGARRRRGRRSGARRRLRRELREPPCARRAAGASATRCWATRRRCCARSAIPRAGTALHDAASRTRARSPPPRRALRAAGCASRCTVAAARACGRGAAARCPPARRPGAHRRARVLGGGGRQRVDAVVLGLTEQLVGRRAFGVRGHRGAGTSSRRACPPASMKRCSDRRGRSARAWRGVRAARAVRGRLDVGRRARVDVEVNPRPTASLEAIEAAYGGACSARTCGRSPASCRTSSTRVRRGGQGGPLRDRGRGRRRQRPLAERGVRDVPTGRAHRRGASDLHGRVHRGDARRGARRARGAGRAAARGAPAVRGGGRAWLTRRAQGAGAPATTSWRPSPGGGSA